MGNELHSLPISHNEISSKSCDHSQSDEHRNRDIAHKNLPGVTTPFIPRAWCWKQSALVWLAREIRTGIKTWRAGMSWVSSFVSSEYSSHWSDTMRNGPFADPSTQEKSTKKNRKRWYINRCWNWSGHGRTILSRSWDIIMHLTFCVVSFPDWIGVVKSGRVRTLSPVYTSTLNRFQTGFKSVWGSCVNAPNALWKLLYVNHIMMWFV